MSTAVRLSFTGSSSHTSRVRHRMVTRALIKDCAPHGASTASVDGVLRCVCTAFLVSRQETLLECRRCRNWCHPACVGVDHAALKRFQSDKSYVCPFCTGACKRPRGNNGNNGSSGFESAGRSPAQRQLPQRLREVPDRLPFGSVTQLRQLLRATRRAAHHAGFEVVDLPIAVLTAEMEQQCLACCEDAIREATFSEQYPRYCLAEVRDQVHPYVQGTLIRTLTDRRVVALVLSNGMDVYGNLRPTLTQLKSGINRGLINQKHQTEFMAACTQLTDLSDFVHITLSATHRDFQKRGLARMLMTVDLLKWALRGRVRAYLNMALEKKVVDDGTRLEFVASPASRRLYESFGFRDVYPRFDHVTNEERWTPKEADMGRVMAHMNFVEDLVVIAARYENSAHDGKRSAHHHSNLTSASSVAAAETDGVGAAAQPHAPPLRRRISLLGRKKTD